MPVNAKPPRNDIFQEAFLAHQSGNFLKAESLYREVIAAHPDRADVLHLLGILCGQQRRYEDALHWLTLAVQGMPDSGTFHNSLGNVYRHLGNIDAAIRHFQRSLTLEPNSPSAHNNLGILYYQRQQLDQAAICYQKAIQAKPDYADAHYNLSMVYTQQQDYDLAMQHLRLVLQYQPDHIQAQAHLGQLLLQQGKTEEAAAQYRAHLEQEPYHVESHHQLAVALTRLGDMDQAIQHYQETLTLDPDHVEALHNLGALYLTRRQPDKALEYYLRLLEHQQDLDTYYNLGVIYLYQDRHEEAIYYLQEALRLQPDFLNAHLNLGAVYLKKLNPEQAVKHYESALALRPNDPEILYILAAIAQQSHPTTAPRQYVEHLFDEYAPYFDKHLQEVLNYQVPQILSRLVTEVMGSDREQWEILDLGCGTGLCGVAFKPFAKRMVGVDLAEKMLEVARQKQIYDVLEQQDLIEALKRHPMMDLVIAGDVLGYVGDLEETFSAAYDCLKPGGLWVFTTEKTYQAPYYLQPNARFAHHKDYVEEKARKSGFLVERCHNVILRTQQQQPVEGFAWLLKAIK